MAIYGKGAKGKCDKLVSKIVRRDNTCLRCGSNSWLQTSHIVGRSYSATRTDLDNLQPLCAGCHRYFEKWPREFSHWITETIGSEKYEELKFKALDWAATKKPFDWDAELDRLTKIAEELGVV